jgi:hypothetical protein
MKTFMTFWRRYREARGWGKPMLWSLRFATYRRVGAPPLKARAKRSEA